MTISEPDASPDETAPSPLRARWGWWAASIAAVLVYAAVRVAKEPRFFYWDDTQLGAFGQWYGLGTKLLAGDLSPLAPGYWQGGNYLAEGQWGLWNPVTWIIALGTHVFEGATVYATLIKVAFLVALATGAFLVAQGYGARPWWAALAGLTATVGGQTIFMDAPSWVTGLQNVALFALAWWALERHVHRGASPLPFFVFAYLLVTFGYVFGVIELAALLFIMLAVGVLRREWTTAVRLLIAGVYSALLTVVVYLPGLLTSPVTARAGGDILNDQFLNMDLGDLATSPIATAVGSVRGYWGDLLPVPLQYVTWMLPLLVLFSAAAWRRSARDLVVPFAIAAVTLAVVAGPSVIGPIRYPARMMPYAVLALAVVIAVLASRSLPTAPRPRRVLAAVALTVGVGWIAWAAQPSSWAWVSVAVVLQSAIILAVFWPWRGRPSLGRTPERAAALLLIGSLIVLIPQVLRYPSSPVANFNVPSSVSDMRAVGEDMNHGIMTIGDVYSLQRDPTSYEESLLANLWYLTGKDAASVYTVLPFTEFSRDLCLDLRGATCPQALEILFEDPEQPVADDLALNTVVVIKGEGLRSRPATPAGWTVSDRTHTWLIQRNTPVERAGGIARTDEGTSVTVLARDATGVTLRVDDVAPGGGEIVFSRLAWPGYEASGARITEPERGYLLTVAIDEQAVGTEVTVRFRPPGFVIELLSAIAAGLIGVGWTVLLALRGRRGTPVTDVGVERPVHTPR